MKKILLLFLFCALGLAAPAQTDPFKRARELMPGCWDLEGEGNCFSFLNDSSGTWITKKRVTGSPGFTLRVKKGKLYIINMTELGDNSEPVEIKMLNKKKMVMYISSEKRKLVFTKPQKEP